MRTYFAIAALLISALLGGFAYFKLVFLPKMIKSAVAARGGPPPATVSSAKAKTEHWQPKLNAIGTLVATEGVDITFQVPGVITEIHFESGQDVKAGEKLIKLDTAVEEADLASAKATLTEAQLGFDRQVDLTRRKVSSEANLDAARAKRDTSNAAVHRIEAVIAQKTITAPFSGRVGIRRADIGQYVAPGTALTSLQALDPIRVDFPVPEQSIKQLSVGQKLEVTIDSFPGRTFHGKIQSLDARVTTDTRTLLVRGVLENPDKVMLPGMFANVTVLVGEPRDVVTVPRTAVTYSLYGDSVYVAKHEKPSSGDSKAKPRITAERRFVKVGQVQHGRVVINDGVTAGDEVVTNGQLKLSPGGAIIINNSNPLGKKGPLPKE